MYATLPLTDDPVVLQTLRDRAKAAFVIHLVAMSTGLPPSEIARPKRSRSAAAKARCLSMYLLHTGLSVPLMRVGAAFGRDRSTAGQVMNRVEEWRSHAAFDEAVAALERCVSAAPLEMDSEALALEGLADDRAGA